MMTPTHLFLNWALLEQKTGTSRERLALICGAIFPDIGVWIFGLWFIFTQSDLAHEHWDALYMAPQNYHLFSLLHSFLLWPALLVLGFILKQRTMLFFSVSGLFHSVCDFFLHVDDAYAHLYPLSDFVFRSPVSYWNPAYYGNIFSPIDSAIGFLASLYLSSQVHSKWGKYALFIIAMAFGFSFFSRLFLRQSLYSIFIVG